MNISGVNASVVRTFEDERRRKLQEHPHRIANEQAINTQRRENRRSQEQRRREQPVPELPPAVSPLIFSYRWFRKRIRNTWQQSTPGVKVVATLAAAMAIWITLSYTYMLVFGWIFYLYTYYHVYSGYDFALGPCYRFLSSKDRHSFWRWGRHHQDWFQLNRCEAHTAALERDGFWSPIGQAIDTLITDPFRSSPGIYLTAVGLIVYFIFPPLGRGLRAGTSYVWHAERPFWGKMVYVCLTSSIVLLMANDCRGLAMLVGLGFTSVIVFYVLIDGFISPRFRTALDAASDNFLAAPMISTTSWLWDSLWGSMKMLRNMWSHISPGPLRDVCVHVDPCHCYTERDRLIADLSEANAALQTQLQAAEMNVADEKGRAVALEIALEGSDRSESRSNRVPPSPGNSQDARFESTRSKHWEDLFMARDAEYEKLFNEKEEQRRLYRRQLERLQNNADYTASASHDKEITLKELYEAKATIRNMEQEINALSLAGMGLRHELAKEKESHSEKCKNEAGCQKRIRELEENYDRLVTHMREDQFLVTDACIKLGMDPKEAEHVQLRAYLAEVTIKLAQLYTMGVRGADTTDLQIDIMRKEVAREATYKNRLEREVERLGGNVLDVRIGLDTTRPQDWKVEFMTYEQNHLRIFPLYQRLWQAIYDLNEIFTREGFAFPPWFPQPPRNLQTTHVRALSPNEAAMQLLQANEISNPRVQSLEILLEKLVVAECQRLYNRGLQLLSFLNSNMTVHVDLPVIQGVNHILNEALHEVLDFLPAIVDHPTERRPSPRKQKKFEIYSAMQYSIAGLLAQIIGNKRVPPEWLPTDYLDERFNKAYDTPDNLAVNLANHELVILAKRIQQLVAFAEEYRLPGTRAGPPRARLEHDPDYDQRWNHLVIARTFAELTISHWNVHKSQKEVLVSDEAGRQLVTFDPNPQLLPLDVEKFRRAVGLLPSVREDSHWPDNWRAKMVTDPSSGPAILFEMAGPSENRPKAIEYGNGSGGNHRNHHGHNDDSYPQVAQIAAPKEVERKRLQSEWKEQQERCQQLYNHVVSYGIKGHIPALNTVNLRANADAKVMRRDIENFKEAQNQYVHALTGGIDKFPVPPMRKKGGRMYPFD